MNNILLVYITNPSKKAAKRVAMHLLLKKLIACANIYDDVLSIYPWKGKIAEQTECILIAKTSARHFEKVKKEVAAIHPYDIPCIVGIPVSCNAAYAKWIIKTLKHQIIKT